MNKKDLDILLSKFYRGETTLDEERLLRESLAGDDADALLMQGLEQMDGEVEVPSDLESNLSDLIDQWQDEEQLETKVTPLLWRRSSWWAAAASVAVLAVAGYMYMRNEPKVDNANKKPVIAKVEKKTTPQHKVGADEPKKQGEKLAVISKQEPQTASRESRRDRTVKVYRPQDVARQASHMAQNSNKEILSPDDEQAAIEALEKFSNVLNKGDSHINDASEKINNINNTIQQYL